MPNPPRQVTDASTEAWQRASRVIPGGVSRDQLYVVPPLVLERGSGSRVFDVSGREYVDFLNNYTSLIHGHAHPATIAAITARAPLGTAFGAPTPIEAELAELISGRLGTDSVRFSNSGSEATMLAIQLARYATGRQGFAKFEGGYHGSYDGVRVSVKPDDYGDDARLPRAEVEPGADAPHTDVLPFHDIEAMRAIGAERGANWAAVVVEPVQGSAGMLPAPAGMLEALVEMGRRLGFLVIFDEVMTFRLGEGGMQGELGIRPDLTALAKIIGGGLPIGAITGRRELMDLLSPERPRRLKHSGTYNGNPLSMAAGLATLRAYGRAEVADLNAKGERLRRSLATGLEPLGWSVTGRGSFLNLHDCSPAPVSWRDQYERSRGRTGPLTNALREQGFLLAPRGMACLSTAHTDAELADLQTAIIECIEALG
jgi:glutamate-1-semialdehyde 2,1-aminomutase